MLCSNDLLHLRKFRLGNKYFLTSTRTSTWHASTSTSTSTRKLYLSIDHVPAPVPSRIQQDWEFMSNVVTHVFVSDSSITLRDCSSKSQYDWSGCQSTTYSIYANSDVCVCDTELCNGAVMPSSAGHVMPWSSVSSLVT